MEENSTLSTKEEGRHRVKLLSVEQGGNDDDKGIENDKRVGAGLRPT